MPRLGNERVGLKIPGTISVRHLFVEALVFSSDERRVQKKPAEPSLKPQSRDSPCPLSGHRTRHDRSEDAPDTCKKACRREKSKAAVSGAPKPDVGLSQPAPSNGRIE